MKKRSRGMRLATAAALALAVLATAPAAHAQTTLKPAAEIGSTDWGRVGRYLGCALGVAGAVSGFAIAGVAYLCLTLVLDP